MGRYAAQNVIRRMLKNGINVADATVGVLGVSFKENCPDIRNTRIIDVIAELKDFECDIHVYDPWVLPEEAFKEYGIRLTTTLTPSTYDAILLLVAHDDFKSMGVDKIHALGKERHVLFDVKSIYPKDQTDLRL
jgi:UDP-N-acetyl-D-galactosamine dehydrogenase